MKVLEKMETIPKYDLVSVDTVKDFACIRILEEGPFFGITYHYTYVTPIETDDGDFVLRFEYNVVQGEVSKEEMEAFEEIVASILYNVVFTYAEEKLNSDAASDAAAT